MTVKAYGADTAIAPLHTMDIPRRPPGARDVQSAIAFCGVCHSDSHQVRAEWAGTFHRWVPGHEIVGRVSALGAHEVVVSRNNEEITAQAKSLDLIVNTVAAPHDLDADLALLKRDGTMTLVGTPASPHPSPQVSGLIMKRRSLAGSMIGGIPEAQEMLDFCAEHDIVADNELIRTDEINHAYERMLQGDVKYRFVIDNATLSA